MEYRKSRIRIQKYIDYYYQCPSCGREFNETMGLAGYKRFKIHLNGCNGVPPVEHVQHVEQVKTPERPEEPFYYQ